MSMENPTAIVRAFVEKINARDVAGLCELMPEDHVFIDSLGTIIRGRETMRAGWTGYFNWFPDYQISVTDIFVHDHLIGLFGSARGTYSVGDKLLDENKWEIVEAGTTKVRSVYTAKIRKKGATLHLPKEWLTQIEARDGQKVRVWTEGKRLIVELA